MLGLYEHINEADAQAQAAWYRADAVGVKAEVVLCRTLITDHGVNSYTAMGVRMERIVPVVGD